jgi:hypothetical protein
MPTPPMGASPDLQVPPVNAMGVRQTVNVGLSPEQTTWNLRSALNVAALNCLKPQYSPIVENYRTFLKADQKALSKTYKSIDKQFKETYGPTYIVAREAYTTKVYNYFALPPTLNAFCDASLSISQQAAAIPSDQLDSFAAANLPKLESVFLEFFNSYDQYRSDLAAWKSRYAAGTPATPSLVLVQSLAP